MEVRTRRWCDPAEPDDGFRVLVSRFRPRGVAREAETWQEWWPDLGPSRELHAAFYGKGEGDSAEGAMVPARLPFADYVPRYMDEMRGQVFRIRALADRAKQGETLTLLCSSACVDPEICHRTVLKRLVVAAATGRR